MGVTNIEEAIYGVDDLDASRRFWLDFGLAASPDDDGRFLAANGSAVILRQLDDKSLPTAVEDGSTLREIVFGMSTADAVQRLADDLAADHPVSADRDGTLRVTDPDGFPIAFRVSTVAPIEAPKVEYNTPGHPDRLNTRGRFFDSARPLELTHTVYMTDEPERAVAFYTERAGFVVTDSYPGRGYFMRGGASSNHHNLFILNVGRKRGFHHLAFELSSIHELFGGGLNMTRKGWKTALGPGRHPISSCYFWYFKCPSGGAAEYDFDSDVVDDNWTPGTFEQTPENFAEWCLAAGMEESLLYKGIQSSETARRPSSSEDD